MRGASEMIENRDNSSPPDRDDLGKALAALSTRLNGWQGVPATEHIGRALRQVRTSYATCATGDAEQPCRNFLGEAMGGPSRIQHGDNLALLDAVIAALDGGTGDGWRLHLSGRKGPRATTDDFDKELKIAAFMVERMEGGDFYDSAVADAKVRFGCGASKVGDAYSEYKSFVDLLLRIDDKSPEQAAQMLERVRACPRK